MGTELTLWGFLTQVQSDLSMDFQTQQRHIVEDLGNFPVPAPLPKPPLNLSRGCAAPSVSLRGVCCCVAGSFLHCAVQGWEVFVPVARCAQNICPMLLSPNWGEQGQCSRAGKGQWDGAGVQMLQQGII